MNQHLKYTGEKKKSATTNLLFISAFENQPLLTCFLSRHLLSNKTFVFIIHFDLVNKKVSEDIKKREGDLKKKTTIPNL